MDESEKLHKKLRGKIRVTSTTEVTKDTLAMVYTPGVGTISSIIAKQPERASELTWKSKTVAIVSDGSAVLGLGNIGPLGALPVMEGKAILFREFAGLNGVPIVLSTQDPEEIIRTCVAIAPGFGGINLEDIKAPECFYIEAQLKKLLDIPVFHDDQHGTAIVCLAGLINALRVSGKNPKNLRVVLSGVGAAGVAIARLLKLQFPEAHITAVDSTGILSATRPKLDGSKRSLLQENIIDGSKDGDLSDALHGCDVFIGVSKGGILSKVLIRSMNKDPIIFAMANPDPEILPAEAHSAGAAIVATGRSDFPNQLNNALVFPGLFKGALANDVHNITDEHKLFVANAIADSVAEPTAEHIIPSIFQENLSDIIAATFA